MRLLPALALAACLLAPGASPAADVRPGDASPAILSALGKDGWSRSEPVRSFSPDNLYEEINGEAELYLPYDFRSLDVSILRSESAPGAELRIEVYRHGSHRDAFGIFSQYRHPGQEIAAVGPSEGAVSGESLDFFRGDTFVRMRVASGTLSREALLSAGRAVAEAIPGPVGPPAGARVLSIPSAVPATLLYQRKAMLGYEPLAPGYEARFEEGALSGKLIFLDGDEAATVDRLSKALPGFAALPPGGSDEGEGDAWSAALPQGTLFLKASGGGIVGVLGKMTRGQAAPLLSALRRNVGRNGARPEGR